MRPITLLPQLLACLPLSAAVAPASILTASTTQTSAEAGLSWADFDRDGLPDAFVIPATGDARLLRNRGDGTFADVTLISGLDGLAGARFAAWHDFDGDGVPDLFVGMEGKAGRLLRNANDGTFQDVTEFLGLAAARPALEAQWLDYDLDGVSDLALRTDVGEVLFHALPSGRFEAVDLAGAQPGEPVSAGATAGAAAPAPGERDSIGRRAAPPAPRSASSGMGFAHSRDHLVLACDDLIKDQATAACLSASSTPTLGALYPLTANLYVNAGGSVGIGTITPAAKLDVVGSVRASGQLVSTASSGAPLAVSSTTKVASLNADLLDGLDASAFTQLGPTIEGSEISSSTITSTNLAVGSVTSASIVDGTIGAADLSNLSIDSDKFVSPMTAQTSLSVATTAFASRVANTGATGIRDGLRVDVDSGSAYGVWSVNNGTTSSAYAVRAQSGSVTARACYGEATTSGATVAYGVYGLVHNAAAYGVYSDGDFGGTGAKYFIQPHPTDATKQINFACLEGNESGTYFRGSVQVLGGVATIDVPESFRLVTEEGSVTATATAVGAPALVWIESQSLATIVVRANANVTVNYMVTGTRRGFRGLETIRDNTSFVPEYRGLPFGLQYRPEYRQLLVQNGLLNADFTPNEETARRLGRQLQDPWDDEHAEPLVRELLRAGLVTAPVGWVPPSER